MAPDHDCSHGTTPIELDYACRVTRTFRVQRARGYLLKGVSPETLVEAIRILAAGGTYLYSPPICATARTSVKGSWRDNTFDTQEPLTDREREVLRLMASGINNREIADALLLSEGTVKNHISNIFSKLGVTDRTKAVLHAIVNGLV